MLEENSPCPLSPSPAHTLQRNRFRISSAETEQSCCFPFLPPSSSCPSPCPLLRPLALSSLTDPKGSTVHPVLIAPWVPGGDTGPPPSLKQLLHSGDCAPEEEAGQEEARPGLRPLLQTLPGHHLLLLWLTLAKAFWVDPLIGDSIFWNLSWGPSQVFPERFAVTKCPWQSVLVGDCAARLGGPSGDSGAVKSLRNGALPCSQPLSTAPVGRVWKDCSSSAAGQWGFQFVFCTSRYKAESPSTRRAPVAERDGPWFPGARARGAVLHDVISGRRAPGRSRKCCGSGAGPRADPPGVGARRASPVRLRRARVAVRGWGSPCTSLQPLMAAPSPVPAWPEPPPASTQARPVFLFTAPCTSPTSACEPLHLHPPATCLPRSPP